MFLFTSFYEIDFFEQKYICEDVMCHKSKNEIDLFVEYVENLEIKGYVKGSSGKNGYYDCSGIITSYLREKGYVNKRYNSYLYRRDYPRVRLDDAKYGDLVVFIGKEYELGNHVAVFIRRIDNTHIEILDNYPHKSKARKRIITIYPPNYTLYYIKNPIESGYSELGMKYN